MRSGTGGHCSRATPHGVRNSVGADRGPSDGDHRGHRVRWPQFRRQPVSACWCAISFAVGFRQATFQTLIKRTVDILAGPGTGSDEDVSFTVAPASLSFTTTTGKPSDAQEVSVTNLGSSLLVLWGGNVTLTQPTSAFRVTLPGNVASGESGQIRVWFDPGTEREPAAGWEAELSVSVQGMARKVALTGKLEPPPDDDDTDDPSGPIQARRKTQKKATRNGQGGKQRGIPRKRRRTPSNRSSLVRRVRRVRRNRSVLERRPSLK